MPGNTEAGQNEVRVLAGLAVEAWRFGKLFETAIARLDAGEQGRYVAQMRWFLKRVGESLEQLNCKLVHLEGQPYEAGMPITPINLAEFKSGEELMVDQMLEPAIIGPCGVIRTGTATLRKIGT
jgi:hypothetical protein